MPAPIGSEPRRVEKLRRDHAVEDFDCGREELNKYLIRFAWQNQQAGSSQTYVGLVGNAVVGYHTLAVDRRWHKQGVGKALLQDAMLRTLQAADIAGVRALAVHAKDDAARQFYEHFDFVPSPSDPMHLFVLLKDVRRVVSMV